MAKSLEFLNENKELGGILLTKSKNNSKYVNCLPFYYEITDWRNGVILYLYDIRFENSLK